MSSKTLDLTEFRNSGLLQEANRIFFHPLGLALAVIIEEDGTVSGLGPILDSRDDPEGFVYGDVDDEMREKARNVEQMFDNKATNRQRSFGWVVQPLD